MPLNLTPGKTIKVTISKHVARESAKKTLERLFLKDKSVASPLDLRSRNFKEQPKRRGGCIWTKRPNKIHPEIKPGVSATILATPQAIKDLNSVAPFVSVAAA
jgi:hypothetical protein